MLRPTRRRSPSLSGGALLALLLPLLHGCPSDYTQLCPATFHQEGVFDISLTARTTSGQCTVLVSADGGPTPLLGAPPATVAALCSSPDAGDGNQPTLKLEFTSGAERVGAPDAAGNFTWVTGDDGGTLIPACNCSIVFTETISGTLVLQQPDAGFTIGTRGFAAPVTGFSAEVADQVGLYLGATPPDGGCNCNIDQTHGCNALFDLTAVRRP